MIPGTAEAVTGIPTGEWRSGMCGQAGADL